MQLRLTDGRFVGNEHLNYFTAYCLWQFCLLRGSSDSFLKQWTWQMPARMTMCMKRKYCVSLKDDFSSTRGKCIRYDFKLRHKASRLKLIIHVLHESRKRSFNMVATWCALLSLGKLASVVNCLRELLPPKPGLSPEFWAMKV